jgi:hypothetical protein
MQPWLRYPISIDDKSSFDLAKQEREGTAYWQIDQTAFTPLTKR